MSFSFLNSVVLWAIPLSLLPIVLHFLFRRPPKTVAFSDLRFLSKVYERYRPRRKLQEWLILFFRVLTLLCLFLFFSRPVFHWGGKIGADDSIALVVILDASYSMRVQESGLSQWDRSIRLAQVAFDSLKESDRSALIVFSDKVIFSSGYLTNEHQKLIAKLVEFQPTFRTTNILPSLQMAYQLLSNSGASNKAILIISDMAKHGWIPGQNAKVEEQIQLSNQELSIKNYDSVVRLLYTSLSQWGKNVAVENVRIFPDLYSGLIKIEADLKNWGLTGESNLPVYLNFYDDNRPFSSKSTRYSESLATLGPLEKKTVVLTAPLFEGRTCTGEIGIRTDSLPADDVFYFAQPSPTKIKVLCVEEPSGIAALSGESYFLRQALTAPPSPFEVKTIPLDELKKISLNSYPTLVLVNPGELDDESSRLLLQYLKAGGSLLVTLGERSGISRLRSIEDFLPCTILEMKDTSALTLFPSSEIDDEEFSHFKSEYDWDKIKVGKAVQPAVKEDGEAWILFSDGSPFLIFSSDKKVAVWTSSIDRSWNNCPSKPLFVPLVRLILKKLTAHGKEDFLAQLRVGESLTKKLPSWAKQGTVSLLDQSYEQIPVRMVQNEMISAPLEKPGIYTLVQHDRTKDLAQKISVNVETRNQESNGLPLAEQELKTIFPRTSSISLNTGPRFHEELVSILRGKEFSRLFLVLAGLSLLSELILISKKK